MSHQINASSISLQNRLPEFRKWLERQDLSAKTRKNYVSDLHRWLVWRNLPESTELEPQEIDQYIHFLHGQGTPEATVKRKLASFRQFRRFWIEELGQIAHWNIPQSVETPKSPQLIWRRILDRFSLALAQQGCKASTIENYVNDVKNFAEYCQFSQVAEIAQQPVIAKYQAELKGYGLQPSTIKRTLASIKRFTAWAHLEEIIETDPFSSLVDAVKQNLQAVFSPLSFFERKDTSAVRSSSIYNAYSQSPVSSYLHLSILIIFTVMIALFGYQQFFTDANRPFAYPSTPTRPSRILSFQGRLTDTSLTPITTPINFEFRLYNDDTAGTELWDSSDAGACSVDPDQDGIFSILLGSTTGGCE